MVFVCMREHEPSEAFAFLHKKADVRQDQIHARQIFFGGERNPQIDR